MSQAHSQTFSARFAWRDRSTAAGASPTVDLTRRRDPLCQTSFLPGERVRVHDCEAAYHESSYDLLVKENGGRCGCCLREGTWRTEVVLPPPAPAAKAPAPAAGPALPRVTLADAAKHYGSAVAFCGRVVAIVVTHGGTFLQFEPGHRFQVLKAVVFARYLGRFRAADLDLEALAGREIVVRGLLVAHPQWGPEIVVHDPGCIEVVEEDA